MEPRLERQEPGGDQVDDVEVAVADAEDGELDLEAADLAIVQAREEEQRDDQHADDVGHQLVAEERPPQAALGEPPHCSRRTTTVSRVAPGLGPLGGQLGQARVVGGQLGVLLGDGGCRRRRVGCWRVGIRRGGRDRARAVGRRGFLLAPHALEPDGVVVGVEEHPPEVQAQDPEDGPHDRVEVAQLVPAFGPVDLPPGGHRAARHEHEDGHVQRYGSPGKPPFTHGGHVTGPFRPDDFAGSPLAWDDAACGDPRRNRR